MFLPRVAESLPRISWPITKALRNVIWIGDLFGNNATRQNSICKTAGLFYVHVFFLFLYLRPLCCFLKDRFRPRPHNVKNLSNLSCWTETIRFSCASPCAWNSFFLCFSALHVAKMQRWDFVWRIKRCVIWWHLTSCRQQAQLRNNHKDPKRHTILLSKSPETTLSDELCLICLFFGWHSKMCFTTVDVKVGEGEIRPNPVDAAWGT